MRGGIGRYAYKLVQALRNTGSGIEVDVVCNKDGNGEFEGLSPSNERNSDVLLRIVEEQSRPDVVHVQFEPGLYGLVLDSSNPSASRTFIDEFYHKCKVPIVTTFHSAYTFREWMGQAMIVKRHGRIGKLGIPLRVAVTTWKRVAGYQAFHNITKEKLKLSGGGICFSKYMSKRLGGGTIIYHGADPALTEPISKAEARSKFFLPQDKMIALAIGFSTATKGWDILTKMEMPNGWIMVLNSSKGHFNKEQNASYTADKTTTRGRKKNYSNNETKVIDLQRGFLKDEDLSMLFYACDVVMLPYTITSGSGVMFDALAHTLPFVASDLEFFKEFEHMGLGITAKRDPVSFANALENIGKSYEIYSKNVSNFKHQIRWEYVANQHIEIYKRAISEKRPHAIADYQA
jgi:glycosyltransferase involved in cell wall biosynthesis